MRRGLAVGALLLVARGAQAYVPTRTASGNPIRWQMSCVVFTPDARGDTSSSEIEISTIEDALGRAVANWNTRIGDCSFMRIGVNRARLALDVASDGRPSVVFRADRWGFGQTDYDPGVIGLTKVWFNTNSSSLSDGIISDADIQLNAVNYTFSTSPQTATPRPGTDVADLEGTLTHEIGHALGLAHNCWDTSLDPKTGKMKMDTAPLDSTGQPTPPCEPRDALPVDVRTATMYPFADDRGLGMRMVGNDDVRGICETYPSSATPLACYGYIEGTGCAVGGSAAGRGVLLLFALPFAALVLSRRRVGRDRV